MTIGMVYPPLPNSCSMKGGTLLGSSSAGQQLVFNQIECNKITFLLIGTLTSRDRNGSPIWTLNDIVKVPKLKKGEVLNDSVSCTYASDMDHHDYFIAVSGPWKITNIKSYAKNISFAVKANILTLRFEKLDPAKVRCEYVENRD